MSKYSFNGIVAAKVKRLSLINGNAFTDCFLDPFIECPPGFIALRAGTIEEGKPVYIHYIRVSSIASFDVAEEEAGKLWQQFNPLPETVAAKTL